MKEFFDNGEYEEYEEVDEQEENPSRDMNTRRKNEWKFAMRRKAILNNHDFNYELKPLHYYSKNPPMNSYAMIPNKTNNKGSRRYISKNYKPYKNWNTHDARQINNLEEQFEEC